MVEPLCKRIHSMKEKGRPVLKLRQDNAGENKKNVQTIEKQGLETGRTGEVHGTG